MQSNCRNRSTLLAGKPDFLVSLNSYSSKGWAGGIRKGEAQHCCNLARRQSKLTHSVGRMRRTTQFVCRYRSKTHYLKNRSVAGNLKSRLYSNRAWQIETAPAQAASIVAASMRRMGMSSSIGYTRWHWPHFRLSPFSLSTSGFLQTGHTRMSSKSWGIMMRIFYANREQSAAVAIS